MMRAREGEKCAVQGESEAAIETMRVMVEEDEAGREQYENEGAQNYGSK